MERTAYRRRSRVDMLFQNVSGDNLLARTVTEMGLGAGIDWAASQICAAGSRPKAANSGFAFYVSCLGWTGQLKCFPNDARQRDAFTV